MPMTNLAVKTALDRLINGKTYHMFLLVANTTAWKTAATQRAMQFMSEVVADEAADASYARVAVVPTTAVDAAAPGAQLSIPDVTFPNLAAAVGEILGVGLRELVTNDADSIIIGIVDVDILDVTPDGNDLVVRDGSGGIARLLTG